MHTFYFHNMKGIFLAVACSCSNMCGCWVWFPLCRCHISDVVTWVCVCVDGWVKLLEELTMFNMAVFFFQANLFYSQIRCVSCLNVLFMNMQHQSRGCSSIPFLMYCRWVSGVLICSWLNSLCFYSSHIITSIHLLHSGWSPSQMKVWASKLSLFRFQL